MATDSFTQNVPITVRTEEYELTLVSRNVEISTAARLVMNVIELRLGAAWSIDLRSFSARFTSETIDAAPDGFKGINTLVPFISAAWIFSERIGIFASLGASIALNETSYRIDRISGETEELVPFLVKFSYQLGLIIQL